MNKPKRRSRMYINNRDLYEHMVVYHASYLESKAKGEQKPRLPNYVGECILLIANRLATKRNFARYSFRDEMISDAIENTIMYIHNFDPTRFKNPFAYITRICNNAFVRRIVAEERAQYGVLANSQRYLIEDQLNPNQIMGHVELYDNLQDFMRDFEEKNNIRTRNLKSSKKKFQRKVEIHEFWAA